MKPIKSYISRLAGLLATSALCLVLSPMTSNPALAFYDFESLGASGFIGGQDGWEDQTGRTAIIVEDQTAVNGTQVVQPLGVAHNNVAAFLTRTNDTNFGFVRFSGFESRAILQFDLTGEATAYFALGHDVDGNGLLIPGLGEIGPAFGIYRTPISGTRMFRILAAGEGSVFNASLNAGERDGNDRDDWYRLQLHIDFNANGGAGAGSLYYMNLTDGDGFFQPVAELQNLNLEMNSMDPDAEPRTWDALYLQLQSDGFQVPSADNLGVPRVAAVLQPDGNIYLQPLDVFGISLDVVLALYNNPDDPDGLYWKLGSRSVVNATEAQGASVESNLDLYLNPLDVFNWQFEMTLKFYDNPRDPEGLYWHYVPGTAIPR